MAEPVPPDDARQILELQEEVRRLRAASVVFEARARDDVAEVLAAAQHRVRNVLAAVRAILSRPAQSDTTVEDYSAHLIGRVDTLVRLQGVLTRSPGNKIDLEEMVREEFVAQGGLVISQVVIDGPAVAIPGKVAEVLGLAIHELAANSVKFGALATDAGHVEISWRLGEEATASQLTMEWRESGVPPASGAGHRGFGRELIEDGLPYQLGATTVFDLHDDSFTCTIVVSIDPPASTRLPQRFGQAGP